MRGKLPAVFDPALALCAALLLSAPSVCAQSTQRQTPERRTAPPSTATPSSNQTQTQAEPDVSITARVTADSLRFERVPNPQVEFTGRPRRETVWESQRQNLPDQVQPGVTYRDIGITLRITSVFADIDRIVAEALGEIPLTDDAPTRAAPPTQTPSPPDAQTHAAPDPRRPKREAAQTSPPAKASARADARGRAGRRGRGM